MGRNTTSPTSTVGRVRTYFGIVQKDMAALLNVALSQINHVETGRRALSGPAFEQLRPLLAQVPASPAPLLTESAITATAVPDPKPLEARRDYCIWKAAQLRWAMRPLAKRATYAHRWQQAMPALLAALPADPTTPEVLPPDVDNATRASWLRTVYPRLWLRLQLTELSPADAAQWHLLRLQAEAHEAEAAALAALLARQT